MKDYFGISFSLASASAFHAASAPAGVVDAPADGGFQSGLKAEWVTSAGAFPLGDIAGFSGATSFRGTHATLTLAWPTEKNPRLSGGWNGLLVPDDSVRVNVRYILEGAEIPLLTGVPYPDGISENYGGAGEVVEIKLEDVTGAASRITGFSLPSPLAGKLDPVEVSSTALNPLELSVLYPTENIDPCFGPFPNALAAADEALIRRQDKLSPLSGEVRARYGDRQGRLVYLRSQKPEPGQPFRARGPAGAADITVGPSAVRAGLSVNRRQVVFSLFRVNPFLEPGNRVSLELPREGLMETVEVTEIGWRIAPRNESMTVTAMRENIL